jgi:hypothetical protein
MELLIDRLLGAVVWINLHCIGRWRLGRVSIFDLTLIVGALIRNDCTAI